MREAGRRIIKKYPNRRLYDTEDSCYIKLDDLRGLVARGMAVRIVDARSGRDISREVLLQLVAEQEALGRPILTESVLLALIRFYDHPLQNLATRYLEMALDHLRSQQTHLTRQFRTLVESQAGVAGGLARELKRQQAEWLKLLQNAFLESLGPARNEDER
jgi:polyhydroxyalkanoate synthesis repressor PhaR